jgi:hypothetical protein
MEEAPSLFEEATAQSSLLTCGFNQDGGCLAIGTTSGFSVHNLHPQYAVSVKRDLQGGIGLVEMLFRCNLMALVGGGASPHAPSHRVKIWDDHSKSQRIVTKMKSIADMIILQRVISRYVFYDLCFILCLFFQSLAKLENYRSDKWSCACDSAKTPLPWRYAIECTFITWPISVYETKFTRPTIPTVSYACPRRFKIWSSLVLRSLLDTCVSNCTACEKLWYVL